MIKGTIFNIQKFCVNDGPGIRTTVFLKGCPLRCKWCHNPESQSAEIEMMFHKDKCTGCGRCKGITVEDKDFVCYNDAKEICGKIVSADEVLKEVLKDEIFYENSGGGITLSGGEPFFQFDFALEVLKKAKENGLNTAIETCGFTTPERIKIIAEYVDIFMFDYKETNPDLHKEFIGVDNELILNNLTLLSDIGKKIILRCPIIPEFNDRKEHFDGICRIADSLEGISHIELESYHSFGEHKYDSLGIKFNKFKTPDEKQKEEWLTYIKENCTKEVKFA
ncbi:MAG: glycyl-radical enzyme activating protein [Ruminococcaceae bacterium]|nr:glycyl-radical enzyme activating protein [Oscillospiraceae bacterium]